MGFFSKFENKMEDTFDNLGDKLFDAPISPVQIAKKAEKQMRRGKMVGAGKQYAPTLYTVLVNPNDDSRLFGYYPTLAGETETYLKAKANEAGLSMDGDPLVRFIVDNDLKHGKFDIIAEAVAGDIIEQLRQEEMNRYGVNKPQTPAGQANAPQNAPSAQPAPSPQVNAPIEEESAFAPINPVQNQQNENPVVPQNSSVAQAPQQQNIPQAPVQQAPLNQAAPQPVQAPMQEAAPAPQPVQAPNAAPQNNEDLANKDISSNPTAVFAGGFDVSANSKIPINKAVPPAHLRDAGSGKVYTLNAATIVIGRENTCNVVLPDVNASRQHAQITFNNGVWFINDLGSTNGTFVNNQEINSRQINSGDIITIGVTNLSFNVG